MRTRWFVVVLSLSVLSPLPIGRACAETAPPAVWTTDFAAAEKEAARLHRPLVVHFYATWCEPCRRMEKEVLRAPQVLKTLDEGFVAVKVDIEKYPKLQTRFNVTGMPTDVILGPDGKVLSRTEGYDPLNRAKYIANITRIDARFASEGKRLARSNAAPAGKTETQSPLVAETRPAAPDRVVASTTGGNDKLVPPPAEPRKTPLAGEAPAAEHAGPGVGLPATVPDEDLVDVQVAMDGFCPVTLRKTRTWKAGSRDFSIEYDGQVFYFAAAEKLDEFKSDPARFAPRLLGCDPVVLSESDLAIRGSTKFGAFYDGGLFLFESAESRAKFRKSPSKFSQLRHALRPEDVKRVASNEQP